MAEVDQGVPVGVVLGSEDSTPLELWIGIAPGQVLQLDDLVVMNTRMPDGAEVVFHGVVDLVRKRFEGKTYDTDAFRFAAGTLPVDVSHAAHIQVTRIEPEVFAPLPPGEAVRIARGPAHERGLGFDRMQRRLPIGLTRSGETVYANLEFIDGSRGAHMSISGISGVATKTSYATFLLYSLFHSGALGAEVTNTKALVFNVKGEDLLWLNHPNQALGEVARRQYQKLGLPIGPFRSVGIYAPARRSGAVLLPDTGGRQEGVFPYVWTLRELARQRLLRFAFAEAEDSRSQLSFVIEAVERELALAARDGDPETPWLVVRGRKLQSFLQLVELLDGEELDEICPRAAPGTKDAFRRRLYQVERHVGHLVRGDPAAVGRGVCWEKHQVTVVDLHRLHATAQMFVVGVLLKGMMEDKERKGTAKPLMFVVLDELNKYAPRSGWSPLQEVLLDVAERGRSLGMSLVGAQQTASEVERRVIANASLRVVGRLDTAEAERAEYGWLSRSARQRAGMLQPGTMMVGQPELPVPLLVTFPFPAWATRKAEALSESAPDTTMFDRLEE